MAILVIAIFSIQTLATASGKQGSKFGGVQIVAITYSYRSMQDQSLPAILNYVTQSGLSSVELMGDHGVVCPGNFTVFPQAIGLVSMWNPDLHYKVATAFILNKLKIML